MESFRTARVHEWTTFGLPAFQDNYLWALVHDSGRCIMVDPGCARTVESFVQSRHLHLTDILLTHHHPDHIGGVQELIEKSAEPIQVWGPSTDRFPMVTKKLEGGDSVSLDQRLRLEIMAVPGHTLDHLAYVLRSNEAEHRPLLFCGDTLFSGGCGRLFEGSYEQMFHSLKQIANLPDETLVYCAHEYTLSNLKFLISEQPEDLNIQDRLEFVKNCHKEGKSTIPVPLAVEKLTNLFIRARDVSEFKALRQRKDTFKST